jgi:adenosylcobinamide-GDP ribazoletransferase
MRALPYVRDDDSAKAKPMATALGPGALLVSALAPLALLPLLADWRLWLVLPLGLLPLRWWLIRWFHRRLGGYTGDCLGAAQQLAELLCDLLLAARWWWQP